VLLMLAQSSDIGGGVGLLVLLVLYFVPTIVAARRKHHNTLAICALNLFLGWTVIGWIGEMRKCSLGLSLAAIHRVADKTDSRKLRSL
jgi:hypothetical protein